MTDRALNRYEDALPKTGVLSQADFKVYKPVRKPALLMFLLGLLLGMAEPLLYYADDAFGLPPGVLQLLDERGGDVLYYVVAAGSMLITFALLFLVLSFFQAAVPRAHRDIYKAVQKDVGRDPITEALVLALAFAVIWGVGTALIMGVNALANGAGIPLMIVWSFVGMAFGLAGFAGIIRGFFVTPAYRRRVWERFLKRVNRERELEAMMNP